MSTLPAILLTGFEPFGGSPLNPSQQIVEALAVESHSRFALHTTLLPVDTQRAPDALRQAIAATGPAAIILLGQAGRRAEISVERVAINVLDFRIADNSGRQPIDEPIIPGGPAAFFSTLPIRTIVRAIQDRGVPAAVSNSAGTYLCNQVMYITLHHIARKGLDIPAGFIHVPSLPEQILQTPGTPSMALATSLTAVRAAIATMTRYAFP